MNKEFDLQSYITSGVEHFVANTVKATLKNPGESAFLIKFVMASKKASAYRKKQEKEGLHIPAFLIASITSRCNLHCEGCYSRDTHATFDGEESAQLSADDWADIFCQAGKLGISFMVIAGGEPLLRRDVIKEAAKIKNIMFPVFTNGTFFDEEYLSIFAKSRNLLPVLSIEGDRACTDKRRGDEQAAGGCLAAGRGFFHINSRGDAESCPMSPYSDVNVKEASLEDALRSPFFRSLKESGLLSGEHKGGCALAVKNKEVKELLKQ